MTDDLAVRLSGETADPAPVEFDGKPPYYIGCCRPCADAQFYGRSKDHAHHTALVEHGPAEGTPCRCETCTHLREIMQKIEASRPHLFCRPEDKERMQAALDRVPWGGTANLYCSPHVPAGTVVLASPPASDLY